MAVEIKEFLENEGYLFVRETKGRGLCGIRRFIFTTGLCYGLDETGYEGRYCYTNTLDALEALTLWSGEGDPADHEWIKHKGKGGEYSNLKILD